jgi:uncharacterized protein with von Willebrand factor type A (vWA) domain
MPFHFSSGRTPTFEVSRWERYLYDVRAATCEPIQNAVGTIAGTVHEARRDDRRGMSTAEREAEYVEVQEEAAGFGAETFARLYNGPAPVEGAEGWSVTAHRILDELPEWSALRDQVAGDPDFAALAAREVLPVVAERLPSLLKSIRDEEQKPRPEGGEGDQAGEEGEGDGPVSEQLGDAGRRFRAAMRRAVAAAAEQVAEAREAMAGLAPGSESAPPTHEQKDPRRLALAQLLLSRPDMRDVLRRAGKLARLAQRKEAVRDPHARGEVVGLERGADLARVLPAELAVLGDDDLDVLFYARFGEAGLAQYKLEGKEPQGKGPIVLLLDESGSMSGDGERWAKAAAIATVAVGQKERREVIVAFFQTRITAAFAVLRDGRVEQLDPNDPAACHGLEGWGDVAKLVMELLTRKSQGGTIFDQPLSWAVRAVEEREPKADILFVTDGLASANADTLAHVERARAGGLRVFGLTVGGGSVSPAVQAVCTATVDLDRSTDVEADLLRVIPTRPS